MKAKTQTAALIESLVDAACNENAFRALRLESLRTYCRDVLKLATPTDDAASALYASMRDAYLVANLKSGKVLASQNVAFIKTYCGDAKFRAVIDAPEAIAKDHALRPVADAAQNVAVSVTAYRKATGTADTRQKKDAKTSHVEKRTVAERIGAAFKPFEKSHALTLEFMAQNPQLAIQALQTLMQASAATSAVKTANKAKAKVAA